MEYILNYAAISYFGISPGIFGALFKFNIFDELDFWIDWDFMRENSRERKLFQKADYMSKLVPLDRDLKIFIVWLDGVSLARKKLKNCDAF